MQTSECSKYKEQDIAAGSMAVNSAEPFDRVTLQLAFKRFSEAGHRLEKKYELLRHEAEELRARLREKDAEIARTARLAMLGQTAAAIAHEVRNPLGSIKLFVSLLKQDLADRPDSLQIVDGINKSLATLDNVVANILQFSRQQKSSFAPVNIHSIIQEQAATLLPADRQSLSVRLDLQALPFISGNEHALRQVFCNLILNAFQAMRYSGNLSIRTWNADEGVFKAAVSDSGPGIPEHILCNIFEPFVTSKNEGTGLGLAIVKKILSEHHGHIEAANGESGKGAVFTITLPRMIKEDLK